MTTWDQQTLAGDLWNAPRLNSVRRLTEDGLLRITERAVIRIVQRSSPGNPWAQDALPSTVWSA